MHRVWKEVLLPCPRQFDAHGRPFAVTRANVRQAYRNVRIMLSRGVPIPCIAEHLNVEAGDTDEWRARYAKHTFGHVSGARMSARGTLELQHDLADDDGLKTLSRCKFVSPKIYPSYADSRGGSYRGTTIAHVAVTPTPVQFWQQPFQLSRGGLYLSYSERGAGARVPPTMHRTAGGRSLSSTREGAPVADEPKKDDADKGGADGDLKALIDALRGKGMNISDKVSSLRELTIAVESAGDAAADLDDDLDDLGAGDDLADTAPGGGGAPLMMSTTSTDPVARTQAQSWARDERADMMRRRKALFASGRIDRPEANRLKRQILSTEMSFTPDAECVCPVGKTLAEFEKRGEWTKWAPHGRKPAGGTDLSATRVVDAPAQLTGATAAQQEAAAEMERMCKPAGARAAK